MLLLKIKGDFLNIQQEIKESIVGVSKQQSVGILSASLIKTFFNAFLYHKALKHKRPRRPQRLQLLGAIKGRFNYPPGALYELISLIHYDLFIACWLV